MRKRPKAKPMGEKVGATMGRRRGQQHRRDRRMRG
jgi:hypothetical protein